MCTVVCSLYFRLILIDFSVFEITCWFVYIRLLATESHFALFYENFSGILRTFDCIPCFTLKSWLNQDYKIEEFFPLFPW